MIAGTVGLAVAIALFAAACLCAALQVLHAYLRSVHSSQDVRRRVSVYEAAVLVHMVVMAGVSLEVVHGAAGPVAVPEVYWRFPAPASALWANFAVAAIVAYEGVAGVNDSEGYDGYTWMPLAEAIVLLACTPLAFPLPTWLQACVLSVDAVYFTARSFLLLVLDRRLRNTIVSPLSIVEALKQLPEGILYTNEAGRPITMNDTMRHCLSALGVTVDFARPGDLWDQLSALAQGNRAVRVGDSLGRDAGTWVTLRVGDAEVRLFSFEGDGFSRDARYPSGSPLDGPATRSGTARRLLGEDPHMRIVAYDVTREIAILQEIERATDELEASRQELQESLGAVREAAENEALLRMRGRVHDVIGQRLSILHRTLEDGDVLEEKVDQMKPLLNGILDDLSADMESSPADDLAATVDAFALTGVQVRVDGQLPADAVRAKAFADCVREGATNAVKHAHARVVDVKISEHSLTVANDGAAPVLPLREGTGLSNMRASLRALGGSLEASYEPPLFILRISA